MDHTNQLFPEKSTHTVSIFSNAMVHIMTINIQDIEAFIIYKENFNIFALQLFNHPNILLQSE